MNAGGARQLWVDGAFVPVEASVPVPAAQGTGPFETMAAVAGELPLWPRHLARLTAALRRLGDPAVLRAADLRAAARELLARNGDRDGVVRLQRTLGPRGGCTWISTRARGAQGVVALVPALVRRTADAPPADLKATPRTFHDAVLAEARAAGADDGIAIGDDGRLLETSVGNLWLCLEGVWCTPPPDGRLLPGIARALLLERAAAAGVAVAERACDLADLHRAAALAVSNAVHGPRPAVLLAAGAVRPVAPSDTRLAALWRAVLGS